ncbi:MAG: DUF4199 domain-containing protein [Ignavibacteria bacterium]
MKNIKLELKWAIYFVIMQLFWMLFEKSAGLYTLQIEKHATYSNFIAIPAIAVYVLALLDKRSNFYEGTMTYLQGFITGLMITVFVTLLSPIVQYIVSVGIAPEFFPNMIKYSVENGKMTQDAAEKYFNLKNFIVQGMMFTPVMGIVTTLFVTVFVKKKSKEQ